MYVAPPVGYTSDQVVQIVEVDLHRFLRDPECAAFVAEDVAPASAPEVLAVRIN
jgi:hypothetical protein